MLSQTRFRSALVLLPLSLALCVAGCKEDGDKKDGDLAKLYSPQEWLELFKGDGWVPLPFPDGKYRPGSIIRVNDGGIRWIDNLYSCRYPDEFVERGSIPAVSFTKSKAFDADVLLNYAGIEAGPGFGKVDRVTFDVSEHSADAFKLLALKVWWEDPAHRSAVSSACMEELEKPDMYLVTEAFVVSKGTYSLYDKTGAKLKLTVPALTQFLSVGGNVSYEVTADGKLAINEPAVFAVRRAVHVDEGFTVLGEDSGQPRTADDEIAALYLRSESK